jgi:hypothetical protein
VGVDVGVVGPLGAAGAAGVGTGAGAGFGGFRGAVGADGPDRGATAGPGRPTDGRDDDARIPTAAVGARAGAAERRGLLPATARRARCARSTAAGGAGADGATTRTGCSGTRMISGCGATASRGISRRAPSGSSSAPCQKYPEAAADATRQEARRAGNGKRTRRVSRAVRTGERQAAAAAIDTVFLPAALAR